MNDLITLVGAIEYVTDADGNEIAVPSETTVYCEIKSVMSNEFYAAGQQDLKPTLCAEIWRAEYGGQKTVIYDGQRMTVYRTYKTGAHGEKLELHCAESVGA